MEEKEFIEEGVDMEEESAENELVMTAMQIILHAGDCRLKINEALEAAKKFDFETAAKALDEAEKDITEAHKSQTEVVQNEMSGYTYNYSLLFTHAQDTLMTIKTELNMARTMVDILKIVAAERNGK